MIAFGLSGALPYMDADAISRVSLLFALHTSRSGSSRNQDGNAAPGPVQLVYDRLLLANEEGIDSFRQSVRPCWTVHFSWPVKGD